MINQTSIKALVIPLPARDVQQAICEQVNAHLETMRELQRQAAQEMGRAASASLGLADGSDYCEMSVDGLIDLAKKLRGIATVNGRRFSALPKLGLENEDVDDDDT